MFFIFDLGLSGLQDDLKTNFETGLTPIDFSDREMHFGSNYKPPPQRTPFIKLFLGAINDFMLKLLLVCACISISIDVGFADPSDRSHCKLITNSIKFYSIFSLDRRICYFCSCICSSLCWILE